MPTRAWRSSSRTFSSVARPERTARSASSSCASGIPKAAMTASPANFSTVPPWVTMQCATSSKNRVTWRRTTSGSRPARRSVESTRSTNSTVASLRSTSTWYVDGIWLGSPRMLDPTVFKAYDVRGLYPSQLDEEGAYAIGRAVVEQFEPRRFAVGRDMRLSSPSMAEAAIRGAADAGAKVLDLGMIGTEMLYFAVGDLELDGGLTVTASHNPKDYTGMKIVRRGALPVGGDSGLLDVRDRAMAASWKEASPGSVEAVDVWPAYVDRVMSFVDVSEIRPLTVVIDAANGMAGAMLPPVLERLPVSAERFFFEPDGSFPNHEPNPLLEENRKFIVHTTLERRADLGVAFDGDADRCFFVDDTGEFVPGDFVTALFAESVLAREPGATIIYDVRASWAVPETIERDGGVPVMSRVGHAFIKALMRKVHAAFAGEVSGHYYFRDFSQADTGVVPFLLMLELIS